MIFRKLNKLLLKVNLKKPTVLLFFLFALISLVLGFGVKNNWGQTLSLSTPQSLADLLYYYDIKTEKEKKALAFLMRQANILKPNETFTELFPKRNNTDALLQDVLKFLQLTQQHFTLRSGTQERWEVKPAQWMEKNPEQIFSAMETLGFTLTIPPISSSFDVICILGARTKAMENRLNYASELLEKNAIDARYLVFLVGERKVTIGVDGSESVVRKS